MSNMFENPFISESKKAKKSLFKKGADFGGPRLSKKQIIAIEKIQVPNYGPLYIEKSQLSFLKQLEKSLIKGYNFPPSAQHEKLAQGIILKILKKPGVVDDEGHILKIEFAGIDISDLEFSGEDLPYIKELRFKNIPPNKISNIGDLSTLETYFYSADWGDFPQDIGQLKKLKKLIFNVKFRMRGRIPEDIFKLTELEEIGLGGANIAALGFDINKISQFKKLKILRLHNCGYAEEDKEAILKINPKLEVII